MAGQEVPIALQQLVGSRRQNSTECGITSSNRLMLLSTVLPFCTQRRTVAAYLARAVRLEKYASIALAIAAATFFCHSGEFRRLASPVLLM